MATKARHIEELPIKHFMISSSQIVQYLQNELGFPFDSDFQLCDTRAEWEKPYATEKCYVIMRAVFRPDDICMVDDGSSYVDRVLQSSGSGIKLRDNVYKILEKFMFPKNFRTVMQRPDILQKFANQGIYGPVLDKLVARPGIFCEQTTGYFGVYLRPEEIIKDMLSDEATNKLEGVMRFGHVSGDNKNAAAITWGVNVYLDKRSGLNSVNIEDVFGTNNVHTT
jgi:hypothetical protein